MPLFVYEAVDIKAKSFKGTFEARDAEDAMGKLRERSLFVLNLREKETRRTRFSMKPRQLADFCKELSLMLSAGLPLIKALNIISTGEIADKRVKVVYTDLHRLIKGGLSLSEAMREQGRVFPPMVINMFYSGEISGTLAGVADKMAEYYTADYKLRKKIASATTYPKILGVMIVAVVLIIFLFVLPEILTMLEGQELPAITAFMKRFSDYLVNRWYNVLMFVFGGFLVVTYLRSVRMVRYQWHKMILKMPRVAPLLRIIYTARFARTLSSLYGSGVQLITGITVSSKIIGNLFIEDQFPEIIKRIKQGEQMSDVLADVNGFSGKLRSVLVIGEETGKLDDILNFAAGSFEYDADAAITSLLELMQPALLVIVAAIICVVIIGVLLPIFQMYDSMGGM